MSESERKYKAIQKLLQICGLGFEDRMTRDEVEALDLERQVLVLRNHWAGWSAEELEELLGTESPS